MVDGIGNEYITHRPRSGSRLVTILACAAAFTVLTVIMYPAFSYHGCPARQVTCLNNIFRVVHAIQLYAQDHNGRYPDERTIWNTVKFPSGSLECPTYGHEKNAYGYNAVFSGKNMRSHDLPSPGKLPIVADSKIRTLSTMDDIDFRHIGKANIAFADGHAGLYAPEKVPALAPWK